MLGTILLLGSIGYLGYKGLSSSFAKASADAHIKSKNLNIQRQQQLRECMRGRTEEDRQMCMNLLKAVDVNKTSRPDFFDERRKVCLQWFQKYYIYEKQGLISEIQGFSDYVPAEIRELAVWLIAQHEGWTYTKSSIFPPLPSYCDKWYNPADDNTYNGYLRKF